MSDELPTAARVSDPGIRALLQFAECLVENCRRSSFVTISLKRFRRASLLEARRNTRYRATRANPYGGNCYFGPAITAGCITDVTTYSPILSPISVPTRVEKR
jgi:hypothetical protein